MRKVLILLLVVLMGACGDSTGPDGVTITGTYTLRTINGGNPPVLLVQNTNGQVYIDSGSMTLNADGTFSERARLRAVSGSQTLTEDVLYVGTYTSGGGVVIMQYSDGERLTASSTKNALTFTSDGVVYIYRK